MARPACDGGMPCSRDPETEPRRSQQVCNRPSTADRSDLGSADPGAGKGEAMARKGRLWGNPVKSITVGEKVPLELNQRERDLIIEHTFADNDLTDRLRIVPSPGRRSFYRFTLDELAKLDELAGYVAAEAN